MTAKKFLAIFAEKLAQSVHDEEGAETIEAAMIVGFIIVLSIAAVVMFRDALAQRWNDLVNAL